MADAHELFRRLSSGAKFSKISQQGQDINRLRSTSSETESTQARHAAAEHALDFFGTSLSHKEAKFSSDSQGKKKKKRELDDEKEVVNDDALRTSSKHKRAKNFSQQKLIDLEREKVNALRNKHNIHISGSDVPDPVQTFQNLQEKYNLEHYLVTNVIESGYQEPTPIQMQAIPLMLKEREILACAPTGSGKTVAFILPLLHKLKKPSNVGFRAVVVSPTRELAQQIYREFCRMSQGRSFKIHVLSKASAKTNAFGPKSSKKHDILVTTPNRLVHLLSQDPPAIQLHNVEWLVLDEADKLFEEGKDGFRDQIATIYQACDHPRIHRGLFSATLSNGIEEWTRLHLDNAVTITIGARNSATASVKQELLFVGQEDGKILAVRDIIRKGFTPPMLVFVQSKERAKELFHELIYDGINVDVIHSDRTQAQRDNIVRCFRTGKIWVLICTELMGRGIDFKGVNLVINYDFPTSAVTYIHRIGRTGRAGRQGHAITFFTEDDAVYLRSIANVMQTSGCDVPDWMLKLKKPSRRKQKKLASTQVERSSIKTVTKYDLQKAKRRRRMIEGSKRKAAKLKDEVQTTGT